MIATNSCTAPPNLTVSFLFAAPTTVASDEQIVDVSSGPSTHDKNTRKKRMAKVPAVKNTKAKKQKLNEEEDQAAAMYEKYVKHGKPLRKTIPNEQP